MSLSYSGVEPQPSLAWTFESSNVDIVTGLAPSSQVSPGPAQLQGSAALVTNAPTSNTAVYFPSIGSPYMDLGVNSPAAVNVSTSNLFVECWVYQVNSTTPSSYQAFIGTSQYSQQWVFRINGGTPGLWIQGSVNTQFTSSVPSSTWTHVAFSWALGSTSNTAYFFINGAATGSVTSTTPVTGAAGNAVIGTVNGTMFNGYIRDLRVVQGGVVPTTSFTPGSAPFSYTLPSYVTGSGSVVFTLLGQFVTYVPGKYNQALYLNNTPGSTSPNCSVVYSLSSLPFTDTSPGSTVSLWLNPDNVTASVFQVALGMIVSSTFFNIYVNSGNKISFFAQGFTGGSTSGGNINIQYSPSLVAGTWYHVSVVMLSGSITFYVNGASIGSGTFTNSTNFTSMSLGKHSSNGQNAFEGKLDDLRIYNTALTAAQVQSVYSSQGAPAPSRAMPLPKLAWDFNGTMNDYVTGLAPSGSNVATLFSSGKYLQSANVYNSSNLVYNNVLYYSLTTPLSAPPYTISLWFKLNTNWVTVNANQPVPYFSGIFRAQNAITFNARGQSASSIGINYAAYDSTNTLRGGTDTNNILDTTSWTFVSFVITSDLITIYIQKDGSAQRTYYITPSIGATFNQNIGALGTLYGGNPGAASGTGPPFDGLIDDLRIFDRALTSAQVQSIYNQQGVPGRGAVQATPTYNAPLTGASNLNRIYGLQILNTAYTGNIINIRRSSDNTNVNFTVDSTNTTLVTASDGQTLSSWLGAGTANVVIWYDQSGNGKNLTQLTNGNQPGFSATTGLLYSTGLFMNFPDNMTITDVSFSVGYIQRGYSGQGVGSQWYNQDMIVGGERGGTTNDYGLVIGGSGLFGLGTGNTDGAASTIATNGTGVYSFMSCTRNSTTGQVLLYNGTGTGTSFTKNTGSLFGPTPTAMGRLPVGYTYGSITADVSSFFMFSSVKSPSEISSIASKFVNSTFKVAPVRLTGTPLFTQLSTSATSSAVGAFSLRAVNGTTVKAVNVTRGASGTFPPSALSSTAMTGQIVNGITYIVSSSSTVAGPTTPNGWNAFDKVTGSGVTGYWQSTGSYNKTTGIYQGSASLGGYSGEWLKLQLSVSIVLTSYSIQARNDSFGPLQNPKGWYILGSTDGTSWSVVDFQTGLTWTAGETKIFYPTNTNTYSYFAIVSTYVAPTNSYGTVSISEWILYNNSTSQDFYADRLGNLLTAPVTGRTLANWLGGGTGYVTTWYDQSGQGKDLVQPTAANQAVINTATSPCSLIFNGTSTNMYNSNFTFNFGPTYNYTIRAVVNNTVGGCLLYRGINGFGWSGGGIKKWWLGAQNGAEGTTGGYPNLVGYSEGYVYGQSAISSSKSSVTWSSSGFSSVALYENASAVTVSYSRGSQFTDQGTYLYVGAGGASAYYNGNIYEIEIFSTPLSASDVTIMG